MDEVDTQEERNTDISRQEAGRGEAAWEEDIEAIDQGEEGEGNNCNPRADGLEERMVRDVTLGKALDVGCFAESEVDNAAADPGDEAGGVGQVHEPSEDDRSAAGAVEVCER